MLALALWAGGCGSGGSGTESASGGGASVDATSEGAGGSATGGDSLSKAAFIKEGDEICRSGESAAQLETQVNGAAFGLERKGGPTAKQWARLLRTVILPSIVEQAQKLRELGAPSGDEQEVEAIIAAIEAAAAKVNKQPEIARGNANPFARAKNLAKAYGFEVCGQN